MIKPQDGKSYVGTCAGAKAALTDYNKNTNEKAAKRLYWLLLVKGGEGILICGRMTISRHPIPLLLMTLMPLMPLIPLMPLGPLVPLLPPLIPLPPLMSLSSQHKGVIFRFCLRYIRFFFTILLTLFRFFHPVFLVYVFFSTHYVT